MSHINTLLMSPDEALVEASRTGNWKWMIHVYGTYNCENEKKALVAAATNGHLLEIVDFLFDTFYHGAYPNDDAASQEVLHVFQEAAMGAAGNGHLLALQFVMSEMIDSRHEAGANEEAYRALLPALEEATKNGRLDIVQHMVNHAKEVKQTSALWSSKDIDSLSIAISEHHNDVVELLLSVAVEFPWRLDTAALAAICLEKKDLVARIYDLYPNVFSKKNLFIDLASGDREDAVKYLYENGYNNLELLADAFVSAAKYEATSVMEFLLETGRIITEVFDKAFETVASGEENDGFNFLYNMKRATPQAIDRAFESTTSVAIIRLLHKNERISDASVIAAFRKAFTYAHGRDMGPDKIEVIKLLFKLQSISIEVIGEAFAEAAKYNCNEVMDSLRYDPRLSSQAIGKAFVNAASHGHRDLMNSLYDVKVISPEMLLDALAQANSYGEPKNAQDIVTYLCDKDHISQAVRHKAFIYFARTGGAYGF